MPEDNTIVMSAVFISVILLLNPTVAVSPSDEDINLVWRYQAEGDITAITAGKINNESAVVFATANKIHVLDSNGNALWNYTILTQGKIYAVQIGDADGDGRDEILLGVGWIETDEIDLNKVYPPPDGIPEEEELLYKVLWSKGGLYVVDNGEIKQLGEVDQWVRSIFITDIDGNAENEIVVISGGYINNYFKKYTNIVYKHRYCWIESDVDFFSYLEAECTCDDCFWDNQSDKCYENKTWEECGWNETIDKGWNLSEASSANASITVFDGYGKLLLKSGIPAINRTFLNAEVSNLYHDSDEEIILGSGDEIYLLNYKGGVGTKYPVSGEVKSVHIADMNRNGNDDMVSVFVNSSTGIYGIEAISREGIVLWTHYPDSGSAITAAYMKKLDTHGANEVLFASDGVVYAVDSGGQLYWSYRLRYNKMIILAEIHELLSADLEDNGLENLLAVSGKIIYNYEIGDAFLAKLSADKYLELGREAYNQESYPEAKGYIERAKKLYEEANHSEGVLECDLVLANITSGLAGNRRVEADAYYAKALILYSTRDYEEAEENIASARAIYDEISDSEGILRCDTLMETINEVLAKGHTTTTTVAAVTVTSATLPEGSDFLSPPPRNQLHYMLLVLFVILAVVIYVARRRRNKIKEDGSASLDVEGNLEEKMEEWKSIEEQWGKLEEL